MTKCTIPPPPPPIASSPRSPWHSAASSTLSLSLSSFASAPTSTQPAVVASAQSAPKNDAAVHPVCLLPFWAQSYSVPFYIGPLHGPFIPVSPNLPSCRPLFPFFRNIAASPGRLFLTGSHAPAGYVVVVFPHRSSDRAACVAEPHLADPVTDSVERETITAVVVVVVCSCVCACTT